MTNRIRSMQALGWIPNCQRGLASLSNILSRMTLAKEKEKAPFLRSTIGESCVPRLCSFDLEKSGRSHAKGE